MLNVQKLFFDKNWLILASGWTKLGRKFCWRPHHCGCRSWGLLQAADVLRARTHFKVFDLVLTRPRQWSHHLSIQRALTIGGKYHCMACIQFSSTYGLNLFTTFIFSFLVKSNLIKLQSSRTVILPPTVCCSLFYWSKICLTKNPEPLP